MESKFARLAACAVIVSLTVAAGCSVSPEQERQIGAADAAKIDSEMPLIRDTAIGQFVTALGESMAKKTSRANLDWHFSVVNSPEVNAFALPGGFIYVNRMARSSRRIASMSWRASWAMKSDTCATALSETDRGGREGGRGDSPALHHDDRVQNDWRSTGD